MSDAPELPKAGPPKPPANGADASGLNLDSNLLQTTIGSLLQSPAAAQMFLNSLNASSQGQALATPQKGVKPSPTLGGEQAADPTLALFSPLPNQDGLVNNQHELLGAYQKAVGVNNDVNKLQESIDSLVRSMGLDLPDAQQNPHEPMPVSCGPEGAYTDGDFNVDELLDQLTANNEHPIADATA